MAPENFPSPYGGDPLDANDIPATANGKQVRVYSKPDDAVPACIACRNTKRWLDDRGIPYLLLNIEDEAHMELAASFGVRQAPMVVIQPAGAPLGESEIAFSGFRVDVLSREFPDAEVIAAPEPEAPEQLPEPAPEGEAPTDPTDAPDTAEPAIEDEAAA